jgi:PAS domain S-box-containing protein
MSDAAKLPGIEPAGGSAGDDDPYRRLFAHSDDAMLLTCPDGSIRAANAAACRLFGCSEQEIRRKGCAGLADPTDPRFSTALERRRRDGYCRSELRFVRADGSVFSAEWSSSLFRVSDGTEQCTVILRDRTAQHAAEAALRRNEAAIRASEERLQLALSGADLGLWDLHLPSGALMLDERWCAMLGYTREEIVPHTSSWEALIHPDDWPRISALSSAHLGDATAAEAEYRMRHKDGRWIWILDRGRVMERDATGAPLRVLGTHMDITARVTNEQVLRDALRQVEVQNRALTAAGEGILIAGADHCITFVNPAFTAITGYSPGEILGRNCAMLQGPGTDPATIESIRVALRTRRPFRGDILNYRKDGTPYWNELSITPVFGDDGALSQFVGVQRDVTARRCAEAERDEALQTLQMIASRVPAFVYQFRQHPDGRRSFPYAGPRMHEYFGVHPGEVRDDAERLLDAVHPDDVAGVVASTAASSA